MADWGFHHLNPWGQGGPDLYYFLLGDNAFAILPWMVKPYSQRQLTMKERISQLPDLQGQEGREKCLWNLSEPL